MAADTHVGYVRNNNEDSFILCSDIGSSDWHTEKTSMEVNPGEEGVLAVVADGMGGMMAGEVASAIAVETIQSQFTSDRVRTAMNSEQKILQFIEDAVVKANENIIAHGDGHPETKGMGTTLVLAWIINRKAFICWCGDSRCYVYNEDRGLIQLTHDHSYVQELVDKGQLSQDEMLNHPYANIITHCLGDVGHAAESECHIYNMNEGDILLLCSDGLTTMCRDQEIETIMKSDGHHPAKCCESLISSALEAGGYDNVTVAVIDYNKPQE